MMKKIIFLMTLLLCHIALADKNLLEPTGKHGVGFQDFRLVNGTLVNSSYSCPGKTDLLYIKGKNEKDFGKDNQVDFCREIMLRVYYPIQTKSLSRKNYYQPLVRDIQDEIRAKHYPGVTEEQILDLANIKTFSTDFTNKEPNIVAEKFPVLIFDPGCGCDVQLYENVIEELASHGYIVMAVNNTFVGSAILFPDGRIVNYQLPEKPTFDGDKSVLNDILFVRQLLNTTRDVSLLKLIAHMHLKKIGLFGHSMGGISVVKAIRSYPNIFQAAISLDAPPVDFGTGTYSKSELAGFQDTPFMRLFAAEWRNLCSVPKDAKFELLDNNYYALLSPSEDNITYTSHMSFSDFSTLRYQTILKYDITQDSVGAADGWRISRLLNNYILEFFNQYLKGVPSFFLSTCQSISNDTRLICGKSNGSNDSNKLESIFKRHSDWYRCRWCRSFSW